ALKRVECKFLFQRIVKLSLKALTFDVILYTYLRQRGNDRHIELELNDFSSIQVSLLVANTSPIIGYTNH
ncbi:hypothetical protein, partial [Staphylococcus gallinarum]|uniref:hypothetical protein n=1 Tax=Staphylococcus gallinarum TaxID=1293 RepID=UPI001C715C86